MRVPTQRRLSLDNESMTPMIDVVFLLLVFFVCASIGQKPESLLPAELASGSTETDVELPAEDPEALPESEVNIRLTRTAGVDLAIELNQQPLSGAAELGSRLKAPGKTGRSITRDPGYRRRRIRAAVYCHLRPVSGTGLSPHLIRPASKQSVISRSELTSARLRLWRGT